MDPIKEKYLKIQAKLQEQGKIPELNPEEQRAYEFLMDARIEKLRRVMRDESLSDLDWAYKFGGYYMALNRRDPRTASLALKRFWRRRALDQKRLDRHRRKRFR